MTVIRTFCAKLILIFRHSLPSKTLIAGSGSMKQFPITLIGKVKLGKMHIMIRFVSSNTFKKKKEKVKQLLAQTMYGLHAKKQCRFHFFFVYFHSIPLYHRLYNFLLFSRWTYKKPLLSRSSNTVLYLSNYFNHASSISCGIITAADQNRGRFYGKPHHLLNNYSRKYRWLMSDIYIGARRRSKYPLLTTNTEM